MQFLIGLISTLAFAAVLSAAIALTIEPFFQAAQPFPEVVKPLQHQSQHRPPGAYSHNQQKATF